MHQVFRLNRRTTLSKFARRLFDPTKIQAELAIECLCQIEDYPFSRDALLRFFSPVIEDQGDDDESILPLPVSTKLGKLHGAIRLFPDDYEQKTHPTPIQLNMPERPAFKTEYKGGCHAPKAKISRSESDRLCRAFCRLEIYRQLFSRCSLNFNHDRRQCPREPPYTTYEQEGNFFQHMPAYQVAEIACVRDYLHRRALGLDSCSHHNDIYLRYDSGVDPSLDGESRWDVPPGWLWAHKDGYYHGVVDLRAKGLRGWGYVFWDLGRLQKADVTDLE